jgi:hypothetical protein
MRWTMKRLCIGIVLLIFTAGCRVTEVVDVSSPPPPQGLRILPLDRAIQLEWLPSIAPDFAGYRVWRSEGPGGRYYEIAITGRELHVDRDVSNGSTYFYAVSAYDVNGNESSLSPEEVRGTPRPEGYDVRLMDCRTYPNISGYNFADRAVTRYDDKIADVFYETLNGISRLDVWDDTDIQDMGYTASLDEIASAPVSGWSPSGSAEAIAGHTYVVWTWDNHYAKIRVTSVSKDALLFDWAFQTAEGNKALKRNTGTATMSMIRRAPLTRSSK